MNKDASCTSRGDIGVGPSDGRRTLRRWLATNALLICGLAPGWAGATTCVHLDETKDGLSPEDQKAARTLFEEALSEAKVSVAREGCSETWTLYHVRLGESVTVVVSGPQGTRRERVKTLEDLPGTYSQMARSLLSGTANTSNGGNVDRRNVTASQSQTRRVKADAIWYGKIGYSATPAAGFQSGPAFGFGRRWELDQVGINFGFLNFALYQDGQRFEGVRTGWVDLGLDYFFDAYANNSLYVGAGLGLATHSLPDVNGSFHGTGLEGRASVGYEMFRASTIRVFLQFDANLPMYRLSRQIVDLSTQDESSDHVYTPTLALLLGLGWGASAD
jgi:hypothetical protein